VDELALSISENGFYRHEPVYAAKESEKNFVIEGNRRLAAVKLLRDDALRALIFCKRNEEFKHINGPQAWESYPEGKLCRLGAYELGVPLCEIASRIGDKHSTVERLYEGIMVIGQAEKAGVFRRDGTFRFHI
jgi:ParB/Sulfiredoxin domain